MSINYAVLVAQGRAKALNVAWTPEELDQVIALEKGCELTRVEAADYVRNGITSVEDVNKARQVNFVPKSLEQSAAEAAAALKENGQAAIADVIPVDDAAEADAAPAVGGVKKAPKAKKTK